MGQRHQIYVRLPKIYYNPDNTNNKPARTVGIYHQWLYGHTAIHLLKNYLTFCDKEKTDSHPRSTDYNDSPEVLKMSYSFDIETAYYHGVHPLTEVKDPREVDNNNGITVIDLEDFKNPAICFMSVGHLETLHYSVYEAKYFDPDDISQNEAVDKTLFYKNFKPIDPDLWIQLHYGREWEEKFKKEPKLYAMVKADLDFLNTFQQLEVARLAKIFPNMVDTDPEQGLYPTPNSVDYIKGRKRLVKSKKKEVAAS